MNNLPSEVQRLIEEMRINGYELPKDQRPIPSNPSAYVPAPKLLLFTGLSKIAFEKALGRIYTSVMELFQSEKNDSTHIACVVSVGDGVPMIAGIRLSYHNYDIFAAARAVLRYHEGIGRLPYCFADIACHWLYSQTPMRRNEEISDYPGALREGVDTISMFLEAMYSVCDDELSQDIQYIFGLGPNPRKVVMAWNPYDRYKIGKATSRFCSMIAKASSESIRRDLALLFEHEAREVLFWDFVNSRGKSLKTRLEGQSYSSLPRSPIDGAFLHIPPEANGG